MALGGVRWEREHSTRSTLISKAAAARRDRETERERRKEVGAEVGAKDFKAARREPELSLILSAKELVTFE